MTLDERNAFIAARDKAIRRMEGLIALEVFGSDDEASEAVRYCGEHGGSDFTKVNEYQARCLNQYRAAMAEIEADCQ
ncbi:hypothetical protein EWI61_03550 [Methylolobus aquaticus]|nr:hypothetical protein EWI61_03550 [Methylolobus aquaticus]